MQGNNATWSSVNAREDRVLATAIKHGANVCTTLDATAMVLVRRAVVNSVATTIRVDATLPILVQMIVSPILYS